MADAVTLALKPREARGKHEARRMRKQGIVPGVLYGHGEGTVAVALSSDELTSAIRHGVRVVDINQDGKVEKALIRDLQWDALGHDILHVDFARVAADERITIDVRLELRGTAPGVTAGGNLDQPLHNLEVECLAIAIPESIRVNISEMQIDSVLKVRDLVLPQGVTTKIDPDTVVVIVHPPVAEAAAAPAAEGEQAEPEVIGRKAAAEEAEEEAEKK